MGPTETSPLLLLSVDAQPKHQSNKKLPEASSEASDGDDGDEEGVVGTTLPQPARLLWPTRILGRGGGGLVEDVVNSRLRRRRPRTVLPLMASVAGLASLLLLFVHHRQRAPGDRYIGINDHKKKKVLPLLMLSPDEGTRSSSSSSSPSLAAAAATTTPRTAQGTSFPPDFVWGVATSSYQVEGAAELDGREPSIWDDFCRRKNAIGDGSSGQVACDHYHLYQSDVSLLASLGFKAYRFSVSWSRLLRSDLTVNPLGLHFYNNLIDELVAHDITPWITMHHWDVPSSLPGGWLNVSTIEAFQHYASVLFEEFGDRVAHWITLNEPWTMCVNGFGTGVHAPGIMSDTDPYVVGHHLLLAHAHAVQLFRERFGRNRSPTHRIGIANCGDYRYPRDPNNRDDRAAADRALQFQWGWFVHPLVHGDYPPAMRQRLGSRLPRFTAQERLLVKNSFDFLGLNYYSSLLASPPDAEPTYAGYWADMNVHLTMDPTWDRNDMGWSVVPSGLRDMLRYIARNYGDPILYVTENGSAEPEPTLEVAEHDEKRQSYFEKHLAACAEAVQGGGVDDKVDLRGYFAWSLMDNFEWQFGYRRRFGICRVDFDSPTLDRTPKGSAFFLRDTIRANGANLPSLPFEDRPAAVGQQRHDAQQANDGPSQRDLIQTVSQSRPLPDRVVLGYGSNVRAVKQAVRDGVNVVVWSFVDFRSDPGVDPDPGSADARLLHAPVRIVTNLDLMEVREAIQELDQEGFADTVHLMSVGGWNGPHLDPALSAVDWYGAYRRQVGDLFHGLDWDLEGNDDLDSPYNVFTIDCLDKMADISRLAKAEGYTVGMAPPQSYLDAFDGGSRRFSRYVNLTDASRAWHNDFSYFGANVYAYLLHKVGDWIDLVFLQFYESYSRASMAITWEGMQPAVYLERFIAQSLQGSDLVGSVDFDDDSQTRTPARILRVPLRKLVLGLANGWADNGDDKTLFISSEEFDAAWSALTSKGIQPRGAGFWTIDEEGTNGAYFARELSRTILRGSS